MNKNELWHVLIFIRRLRKNVHIRKECRMKKHVIYLMKWQKKVLDKAF